MRYLLSGYGTDSKSGEVKQYRTLRGKIELNDDSIKFRHDGVTSGGKDLPCVTFDGKTIKRNKDSINNSASLIFFDMTEDEALNLSAKFAEYALFLNSRKLEPIGFERSSDNFADVASKVLFKSSRASIIRFFERFAEAWELDAAVPFFAMVRMGKYSETKSPENMRRLSTWRTQCAIALRNLIRHYRDGDSVENTVPSAPRAMEPDEK